MKNPIARHALIGVIIALTIGVVAGCVRTKPRRAVVPQPTAESQVLVSTPSPTTQIALPVVGGVGEADESSDVLATPTMALATPTLEPIAALPEPTSTVPAPEATPIPGDINYIVRTGDTLLSIATQYNTTKQAVMDRNGLTNPDLIRVGQTLIIPVGYVPTGTPVPVTVQHTVKKGETLSSIARTYRTTVAAILAANPSIQAAQELGVGVVLTVTWGNEPVARTHRVQPGESLSTIAAKYGLTTAALARANGLADPNLVYVGQRLIIPS